MHFFDTKDSYTSQNIDDSKFQSTLFLDGHTSLDWQGVNLGNEYKWIIFYQRLT